MESGSGITRCKLMNMSKKIPLETRSFTNTPCANFSQCGEMGRAGSRFCSIKCGKRVAVRENKLKAKEVLPECHTCKDELSWPERWERIYAKYGVNRDRRTV